LHGGAIDARNGSMWGVFRVEAFKKTTVVDESAVRPADGVGGDFRAGRPNELWVAELTYVAIDRFGYVAFVIDAFSRVIPGGACRDTFAPTWPRMPWRRRSTWPRDRKPHTSQYPSRTASLDPLHGSSDR
jgi:hypothetical protein